MTKRLNLEGKIYIGQVLNGKGYSELMQDEHKNIVFYNSDGSLMQITGIPMMLSDKAVAYESSQVQNDFDFYCDLWRDHKSSCGTYFASFQINLTNESGRIWLFKNNGRIYWSFGFINIEEAIAKEQVCYIAAYTSTGKFDCVCEYWNGEEVCNLFMSQEGELCYKGDDGYTYCITNIEARIVNNILRKDEAEIKGSYDKESKEWISKMSSQFLYRGTIQSNIDGKNTKFYLYTDTDTGLNYIGNSQYDSFTYSVKRK